MIIEILMKAMHEATRRALHEGLDSRPYLFAVLHPVDYYTLESEVHEFAQTPDGSWAYGVHRPAHVKAMVFPQGLEVRCSVGIVLGWAVVNDNRGLEALTMVPISALPSSTPSSGEKP